MDIITVAWISFLTTEHIASLTDMDTATVYREEWCGRETLATITASMITRPQQLLEQIHFTAVVTIIVTWLG